MLIILIVLNFESIVYGLNSFLNFKIVCKSTHKLMQK